jgi:hypothetical protein
LDLKADGEITGNVEERLNELFSEDDDDTLRETGGMGDREMNNIEMDDVFDVSDVEFVALSEDTVSVDNNAEFEDSPLRGLKSILLSLDWEISDETMLGLLTQIDILKGTYKDDRVLGVFLQIIGSAGSYIKTNKGKSHPDAIKLLNSAYSNMEKVVLSDGMPEAERNKMLAGTVSKFKELKKKITRKKNPPDDNKTVNSIEIDRRKLNPVEPHEAFIYALDEIKQVIKAEFATLRAELKLWRESR